MTQLLIFVAILVGLANGQIFYPLRKIDPSVPTDLTTLVEIGSKVYVSSTDDEDLLKKIYITVGEGTVTAYHLAKSYDDDGAKTGYTVDKIPFRLSTNNTDDDMDKLKGRVYITNEQQPLDSGFFTYDAIGDYVLTSKAPTASLGTIVILNVPSKVPSSFAPNVNAILSAFDVSSVTQIGMYSGVPDRNSSLNSTVNQFFANPLMHDGQTYLINNIETMEVSYDAFYILYYGQIKFRVQQNWTQIGNVSTNGMSTTGVLMNQDIAFNATINLQHDNSRYAKSGYILSNANLKDSIVISMTSQGTNVRNDTFTGGVAHFEAWADSNVDVISVSTTSYSAGTYSIQYFNIDLGPVTTTVATTMSLPSTMASGSTVSAIANYSAPTTTSTAAANQTTSLPATTMTIPTTTRSSRINEYTMSLVIPLTYLSSRVLF